MYNFNFSNIKAVNPQHTVFQKMCMCVLNIVKLFPTYAKPIN